MTNPSPAIGTFLILGLTTGLYAQSQIEKFDRQLELLDRELRMKADTRVPIGQRTLLDFGGSFTFGFAAIDNGDSKTHEFQQYEVNLFGKASIDGVHEFFLRGRTVIRDFDSGDSFDGFGDSWTPPTLERGYYRFDLRRMLEAYEGQRIDGDLIIQGGRQLVHWANGLVLSQALDGGTVTLRYGPIGIETVAGVTKPRTVDFESSRPGFNGTTDRAFYGGMVFAQVDPRHRLFAYGLVQDDQNPDETLVIGPYNTRFGYDSYYMGVGASGSIGDRWQYGIEAVFQGGRSLSNSYDPITFNPVNQTWEPIEAWALDLRLDYLVGDDNQTRFTGELLLASGDRDRQTTSNTLGGNTSGTTDHAFNAFGLIDTGLAFSPPTSNLVMTKLGASTYPLRNVSWLQRFQVGANFFTYHKLQGQAPIDEATDTPNFLGVEGDLYVNWQVTSDVSIMLRYGLFAPGGTIQSEHDLRQFVYTAITFGF